ncbi:MAG: hypothetical protein LUQ31_10530 [Methanoregula sp.]|nr:hypothetical protein [Methanoregula sp.]
MKSPKTLAGGIALLLFVFLVFGFGISPAGALPGSGHSGNVSAVHAHGSGLYSDKNATRVQDSHAFAGNATVRKAHPMNATAVKANATFKMAPFRNTTAFKANATFNTTFRSMAGLHKGGFGNFTANSSVEKRGGSFTVNATETAAHLQSFISSLQKQGVDVSAAETALKNNDTAAVKSWMESYFETHKTTAANSTRPQGHMRNTTARQSS